MDIDTTKRVLESVLLAAGKPLDVARLDGIFDLGDGADKPGRDDIRQALQQLQEDYEGRGIELVQVASGFRFQVPQGMEPWVSRLYEERPPRYSRALLETLSIIAYRQPITRGEIEDIRGVAVSTNITRTLQEREWVRVIGHKDVPGKPAMFGTTRAFLDYFGLKTLDELPSLAELRDLESFNPQLDFDDNHQNESEDTDNDKPAPQGDREEESGAVESTGIEAESHHAEDAQPVDDEIEVSENASNPDEDEETAGQSQDDVEKSDAFVGGEGDDDEAAGLLAEFDEDGSGR